MINLLVLMHLIVFEFFLQIVAVRYSYDDGQLVRTGHLYNQRQTENTEIIIL